jgi:purine nucleosidase
MSKSATSEGAQMLKHIAIAIIAVVTLSARTALAAPEKVILDTDFTTIGDDGKVGVMAAQLHAAKVIELLGITVVAGNGWLDQEVADALKAVERLGIAGTVGVYAGARYPLVHDYKTMMQERAMWRRSTGSPPRPACSRSTR